METKACLTAQQILDLWEDRLSANEATSYQRHLGECPTCLERAEMLSAEDDAYWAKFPKSSRGFEVPAWVDDLAQSVDRSLKFEPRDSETHLIFGPTLLKSREDETLDIKIGPYTLSEKLGEGGMGIVYVAFQTEPIRRQVALKIVKPGMDSREVIARFEIERQALAMMSHPHIAKILDGGTTDTGQPYFVMELIDGVPITEFCDREQLSLKMRLELFRSICYAVQHAHQRGIIHRDLKPTNILVDEHDGAPVPKIIDFGISKVIDPSAMEHSIYTQFAQVIGTPLYMSPEQARLSGQDVDTRSDVYSLGVILYELLTGTTPFTQTELERVGFDEMRRIIQAQDPSWPSHKVSTLDQETLSTISNRRQLSPVQLSLSIRRELDWIVMKCLEKDRERRYESASALAADIERYLNDEPVQACPPSAVYRVRKYVHRHKVLLLTTTLVLLSAVMGTLVSLDYARKSEIAAEGQRLARQEAEKHASDAKRSARKAIEAEEWARTRLYASDMKLVSDAIHHGDSPRAAELLKRHIPPSGQTDLRGFEWYYFNKSVNKPLLAELDQGCWVDDVEASPNGKWLATTAATGTVRIYETSSWTLKTSFSTGSESVHGLAWSSDSKQLAAACGNGALHVWELATGLELWKVVAHAEGANDVVFSADGQKLYTCGYDKQAKVWDAKTGQEQFVFAPHSGALYQMALSPKGDKLATASSQGDFTIWNIASAQHHRTYNPGFQGRMACVAFSPSGRFVAGGDVDGHLFFAHSDFDSWELFAQEHDGVDDLKFVANGRYVATVNRGGAVHLYPVSRQSRSPTTGDREKVLKWFAHKGPCIALTTIRDGELIITGGRDKKVRVWKPDFEAITWQIPCDFGTEFVTGPENRLYRCGSEIEIWDIERRESIDAFAATSSPWKQIACSRDGRYLAAFRIGQLVLFDLKSKRMTREWRLDEHVGLAPLAVSHNGQFIAVGDSVQREFVSIYDRDGASQKPLKQFPAEAYHSLAFSPDGRWLATENLDDLRLFDLTAVAPIREFKGHANSLTHMAFSADGRLLATVGGDRLLKVWQVETGKELFSVVAHTTRVNAVAFSPDGRTLATCSQDREIHLWHTLTGQPIGTLAPETNRAESDETQVSKIEFTPDGQRLIAKLRSPKGKNFLEIYDAGFVRESYDPVGPRQYAERTLLTAGTLDPSFNIGGQVTTNIQSLTGQDQGYTVALLPDGKLLFAGHTIDKEKIYRPAIVRYNSDGSLDSQFGHHGKTIIPIPGAQLAALALQADGKIVLLGAYQNHWAAMRLNADGSPDPTFALTTYPLSGSANAVALQADGQIVAAGQVDGGTSANFGVLRIHPDGTLDSDFDGDGFLSIDFAGQYDGASGLAIQPDGKILVSGYAVTGTGGVNFAIARLKPDGSRDETFGVEGLQTVDFGASDYATGIKLQPDGKIVLGGYIDGGSNRGVHFAIARLNPNGGLDAHFGINGRQTIDFGGTVNYAYCIALQGDGKILLGGHTSNYRRGSGHDFGIVRLTADGKLDSEFNGSGRQVIDFAGKNDTALTMVLQPDGKIVVGGSTEEGQNGETNFALVRLMGDRSLPDANQKPAGKLIKQ